MGRTLRHSSLVKLSGTPLRALNNVSRGYANIPMRVRP